MKINYHGGKLKIFLSRKNKKRKFPTARNEFIF